MPYNYIHAHVNTTTVYETKSEIYSTNLRAESLEYCNYCKAATTAPANTGGTATLYNEGIERQPSCGIKADNE